MEVFTLNRYQIKKLNNWMKDYKWRPLGAIGGTLTYSFTPTNLGVIIKVKNNGNNKEIDLTEYENWRNMKYPKYLYRKSDGERFTLKNGFYSMDNSSMRPRYEYTAKLMIENVRFFVDDLNKCDINNNLTQKS